VRKSPGAIGKDVFRLLTDPPLKADVGGRVVLRTTLPRSLAMVQFLRVVPLGPDGGEPPFEQCGIIPIAVPESRRPPPPQLSGSIDPANGVAALTVTADGLNWPMLAADEPGLFTPGAAGEEPPRSRLRRAVGAVAAPVYARPLGDEDTLALVVQDDSPPVFKATFSDDNGGAGLTPFVPYVYWAEVRLPDERRLPAGWLAEAGGVTALYPAHEQAHPRPNSLPSPPLTLMHVPPDAPAALPAAAVTVERRPADAQGRVPLTVTLTDPPRSHRKAVDKYRLAVWAQWPGQPLLRLGAVNDVWPVAEAGSVSVLMPPPEAGVAAGPLALRLALVDPVGRYGTFTTFDVAEPPLPEPVLSPVQISVVGGFIPRRYAGWQIVQPDPPQPADNYTLIVRVTQTGVPLELEGSLDQVPELAQSSLHTMMVNQIVRLAGSQRYVMRLSLLQPVRVEVTVVDPLGRSVTVEGASG
jgi:hypothetical protein